MLPPRERLGHRCVLEAAPGSAPAPGPSPESEDTLGAFGLGDFAGHPPGTRPATAETRTWDGTVPAGRLASPPGPESPWLGAFPLSCLRTCAPSHQDRVSSEAHSGCLLPGVGLGYFWDPRCWGCRRLTPRLAVVSVQRAERPGPQSACDCGSWTPITCSQSSSEGTSSALASDGEKAPGRLSGHLTWTEAERGQGLVL